MGSSWANMMPTDSHLKKKMLKVLYFIINYFLGNLMFPHHLLKVKKPAPEPSPCHTLVNRFTKQNLLPGNGTQTNARPLIKH